MSAKEMEHLSNEKMPCIQTQITETSHHVKKIQYVLHLQYNGHAKLLHSNCSSPIPSLAKHDITDR